jgi:hypothetical protein
MCGATPALATTTATWTDTTAGVSDFIVPSGVTTLQATVIAGSGGAVTNSDCGTDTAQGGDGAEITTTLAVSGGQALTVGVGQGGASPGCYAGENTTSLGGGAADGASSSGFNNGGGGGGASMLTSLSPTASFSPAIVVVAGGGGGAGGGDHNTGTRAAGGHGGFGANTSEDNGSAGATAVFAASNDGTGGAGGTSSAG